MCYLCYELSWRGKSVDDILVAVASPVGHDFYIDDLLRRRRYDYGNHAEEDDLR